MNIIPSYSWKSSKGSGLESYHHNLFSIFLGNSRFHYVSIKSYHDTGLYKLFSQQKGKLVIVTWENIVSTHGAATDLNGWSLVFFWFISISRIWCLPNVPNKSINDTGSNQSYAKHKGVLAIVAWDNILSANESATALNGESLDNCFCFYPFLFIWCIAVNEYHQHVQCWNTITTTSFT